LISKFSSYLKENKSSSPLAVFRIGFGLLMLYSIIRFWANGWIESIYIVPNFHFSYFGFEWLPDIGEYIYLIFFLCAISSFFITLGFYYRVSIIIFFLSFTYIELIDKTTYLNHYYFISILSFLMIFLPANAYFSIDNYFKKDQYLEIPRYFIDSIKFLISIVYIYAGLAKINSDWLLHATPLNIWLRSKYDIPIIGSLLQDQLVHYIMSWGGMIYDLTIPFLLLYKRTRLLAFFLVIFFHVFTDILFPIGMFPYIMIFSAIIFFDSKVHNQIILIIKRIIKYIALDSIFKKIKIKSKNFKSSRLKLGIICTFLFFQLIFPWRYLLYPGELFWTEQGYRFSWRVMLMDKVGYTIFTIVDSASGDSFVVDNSKFLTAFQEKQMSFQPDFILEYAHYIGDYYKQKMDYENVQVFADSYVVLNGRRSKVFIDKNVDLYKEKESFKHKDWVLPFNDEIKGF
tara:strand:- start:972 stop:2342 length:1371 start_codon:yes stop_codon:yes gene_type:complete